MDCYFSLSAIRLREKAFNKLSALSCKQLVGNFAGKIKVKMKNYKKL